MTPVPRPVRIVALAGLALAALPLVGLVVRAPWLDAAATLTTRATGEALWLSVKVSTAAALVALVIGFPLGWFLARASPSWSAARLVVLLPLVLPPVVGGVGLLAAFGRRGLLGHALAAVGVELPFTTAGAVVAAAFVSFPLVVLAVESGFRGVDPRLEQAAEGLGATRLFVLRHVQLPLLRPALVAGTVLAWARSLGEFGATITFAGNLPGRTQTLPLAVFELLQTDPDAAILVALVLVLLSVAVLAVLRGHFVPGRVPSGP